MTYRAKYAIIQGLRRHGFDRTSQFGLSFCAPVRESCRLSNVYGHPPGALYVSRPKWKEA